jgi:hypothetical protein
MLLIGLSDKYRLPMFEARLSRANNSHRSAIVTDATKDNPIDVKPGCWDIFTTDIVDACNFGERNTTGDIDVQCNNRCRDSPQRCCS